MAKNKDIKRRFRVFVWRARGTDGAPLPDQGELLRHLQAVPYTSPNGSHRRIPANGNYQAVQVIHCWKHAVFGVMRREVHFDLPQKIDAQEKPQGLGLQSDEGLDYSAHFGWWDLSHLPAVPGVASTGPCGLLIWENNRSAASVHAFEEYLNRWLSPVAGLTIEPFIDRHVWEQLKREPTVGAISMRVSRPNRVVAAGLGFLSALREDAPPGMEDMDITFRPAARQRVPTAAALPLLERLAALEEIEQLGVVGPGGLFLDLLEQKMGYEMKVLKASPSSGAPDPNDVHRAIREVFRRSRDAVATSVGLRWGAVIPDGDEDLAPLARPGAGDVAGSGPR